MSVNSLKSFWVWACLAALPAAFPDRSLASADSDVVTVAVGFDGYSDRADGASADLAIRTPESPRFNPLTVADGLVVITWTGAGTLQQSCSLSADPLQWADVTPRPSDHIYIALPSPFSLQVYFRLI